MATLKYKNPNTGEWVNINTDSDKNYTYYQATPKATWIINHSLNKMPSVTTVNSANDLMYGDVTYNSNSQVTIKFSAAVSGKAILN